MNISMEKQSLNGSWMIRWSTGQRGGTPFVVKHRDDREHLNEYRDLPRTLPGSFEDSYGWLPATVPGDVHLDLQAAGILDDPHKGINVFKARWVEECIWHYRRTFDVPASALNGRIVLVLEEVYLTATVYVNGEELARQSNAFRPLVVDLTGKLRERDNELLVRVESGLFEYSEKPMRPFSSGTASREMLINKRVWMRAPQSYAEWDWSPRLLNVGLAGNVTLYFDPHAVVSPVSLRQRTAEDLHSATLEARLFPRGGYDDPDGQYTLTVETAGLTAVNVYTGVPAEGFSAVLTVPDPILWQPACAGQGAPHRYEVTVTLRRDGETVWRESRRIGFRHVAVKQPRHPKIGHYFWFEINGRRTFMKGSNFVPVDLITAAVTPEDYERLTDRALELNMNMLRIWGGGLYESEALYEACDRKGLMVWQEFNSACSQLPLDDEDFVAEMAREARYCARRLSVHPSLVAWCGNNECRQDLDWYSKILPRIVAEEDPEKYYQPASPSTNMALEGVPADGGGGWYYAGDQHPWEVGFLDKDHRKYHKMECRFPNEGGILGPTTPDAMRECLIGPEETYTEDMGWMLHDNMLATWKVGTSPDEDLRFWTGRLPRELSLESYVYGGGFVQAAGLTAYIDNFRRRAFDSSSAIFWMYNDCWPCSRSWTVLDNHARRTPSFYPVRRAFAPVRVIPICEDGRVTVYGVNDTDEPVNGTLRYGAFDTIGQYLTDETVAVTVPANGSTALATFDRPAGINIPFALLNDPDGREIGHHVLLDEIYTAYDWKPSQIRMTFDADTVTFVSPVFVAGVCIDIKGEAPLPDNLFDLLPGVPYTIPLAKTPRILYDFNTWMREGGSKS